MIHLTSKGSRIVPDHEMTWEIELELVSDIAKRFDERETLSIRTRVSPPFPDHPRAMELAALLRAQEILRQQIAAMSST